MRTYETGATRSTKEGKPEYEGYLSPLVIREYGRYMLRHQYQQDGNVRSCDNWQKGIPKGDYIDSAWRHFLDWWLHHRGHAGQSTENLEESLCALMFNTMGYLHEILKEKLESEVRANPQEGHYHTDEKGGLSYRVTSQYTGAPDRSDYSKSNQSGSI